jgi:hypothetical protein
MLDVDDPSNYDRNWGTIQEDMHLKKILFKALIVPTCYSQAFLLRIQSFDLNSWNNAISQMVSLHSLM